MNGNDRAEITGGEFRLGDIPTQYHGVQLSYGVAHGQPLVGYAVTSRGTSVLESMIHIDTTQAGVPVRL